MTNRRISKRLRLLVRERAHGCCEYCWSQEAYATQGFSVEHIAPLTAGGKTTASNLALACQGCNNFKYDKIMALDPISRHRYP